VKERESGPPIRMPSTHALGPLETAAVETGTATAHVNEGMGRVYLLEYMTTRFRVTIEKW